MSYFQGRNKKNRAGEYLNAVKCPEGGAKMPRIKCAVDQCVYQEGSECKASSIQVRPTAADLMISVSDDTACETFKPRNSMR